METPPLTRADFLHVTSKLPEFLLASKFLRGKALELSLDGSLQDANITIDYVIHTEPQDMPKNFDDSLKKCDVYIPEWESWTPEDEVFFNEVSNGTKTVGDIDNFRTDNRYFKTILKHLRGSHKIVKVLDIPQGDPLDLDYARLLPLFIPDYTQSYDGHVATLRTALKMFAYWNLDREEYILNNLATYVQTMKQSDPVRFRHNIDLYMTYGSVHTGMYHRLRNDDSVGSSDRFPYPSLPARFPYLPADEALRRYMFATDFNDPKKVQLPNAHGMANVVMEELLTDWFYQPNELKFASSASAQAWFRDIINRFNVGTPKGGDVTENDVDSRQLWDYQQFARAPWARGGQELATCDPLPELREVLAEKLREKKVDETNIQIGLKAFKPSDNVQNVALPLRGERSAPTYTLNLPFPPRRPQPAAA